MRWRLCCVAAAAFAAPAIGGQVSNGMVPARLDEWIRAGLVGGMEGPWLSRLLLVLLFALPLAATWASNRVIALPRAEWMLAAAVFVAGGAVSGLGTEYPWLFVASWPTWVLPILGTFACVGCLGRRRGPLLTLDALVAGSTVVAVRGVLEYASMRAAEPGYRIFAGMNNPNAAAAVFALALPVAIARAAACRRVAALALSSAAGLLGLALTLTQSKGGIAAAALGVMVALAMLGASRDRRGMAWRALAICALCAALGAAAMSSRSQPGSAPSRLADPRATSVQSEGFRTLLWATAGRLGAERPTGWGVGSFSVVSSRPGLVPPTFNAHQAWLQTFAEGGWAAAVALVAIFWFGVRRSGSGLRHLPADRQSGICAAVGSACAVAAHGLVESNLGFAGVAAAAGVAWGCGMALSNDGVITEPLPRWFRSPVLGLLVAPAVALALLAANTERAKAYAGALWADGDAGAARQAAAQAVASSLGRDGESYALAAQFGGGAGDWAQSARAAPTPRAYRALAALAREAGNPQEAERRLLSALRLDPNNLPALWQLVETYGELGQPESRRSTAERLVAVEEKPYFRVRAIPELVPVQTFDARVLLAQDEPDGEARKALLRGAVDGYVSYLIRTLPMVERFAGAGLDFLGETLADARGVLERGRAALAAYRGCPGPDSAWATAAARAFDDAALSLSK